MAERIRYFRREYNKDGIYQGYTLYKPVISVGKNNVEIGKPIYHNQSPTMEIKPAVKEHTVKHSLLSRSNLIKNPSFEEPGFPIRGGKPPYWGGSARTDRKVIDITTGAIGCGLLTSTKKTVQEVDYIEATKFILEDFERTKIVFSLEYFIFKGRGWSKGETVELYISIQVGSKYLDTFGLWMDNPAYIIIDDIERWRQLEKFEITSEDLPNAGEVTVRLYGLVAPQTDGIDAGYVIYDNVNLSLLIDEDVPPKQVSKTLPVNFRNNIVPPVKEVFLADAPELPNAKLLYRNIWYRADGNLTKLWQRRGIEEYRPIRDIILDSYLWVDGIPIHKLSVTLFSHWTKGSNSVSWSSIIRDPWNRGRHFLITSGTFDDKYSEWKVNLTEVRTKLEPLILDPQEPNPDEPVECPDRLTDDGGLRLLESGEVRLLECEEDYFGDRLLEDGQALLLEDQTNRLLEYHSKRKN